MGKIEEVVWWEKTKHWVHEWVKSENRHFTKKDLSIVSIHGKLPLPKAFRKVKLYSTCEILKLPIKTNLLSEQVMKLSPCIASGNTHFKV